MEMIETVKDYIGGCPLLDEIAPKRRHIDWTEDDPDNYGIFPAGDAPIGDAYINGDEEREYSFAVYVRKVTDSDAVRLENSGFIERLQTWLNRNPPVLPEDCTFTSATAVNAMLLETNKTGTRGTYQVQCSIKYIKHYSMKGLI